MTGPRVETPPEEGAEVFGASWGQVQHFAQILVEEGELRGLIGPRELPRLWTRHLLNSAAVSQFVPSGATVADVGSGAGFPGVVLSIMRPELRVHLVEPMERRVDWLADVVRILGLSNTTVVRSRAEELEDQFDVVTARAVAALRKLVPWVAALISPGGRLLALKGERAGAEVEEAEKVLRRAKLQQIRVHEVIVPGTTEATRVVEAQRDR